MLYIIIYKFVILNLERDKKSQDWKIKNVNFKKLV